MVGNLLKIMKFDGMLIKNSMDQSSCTMLNVPHCFKANLPWAMIRCEDVRFVSKETALAENNKQEKILQAASEIIAEKGLRESTITEIASRAGVVDSIIYHYFKNKEDLLFCALDAHLKASIQAIQFQFQGIIGAAAKMGKMIWYHLHSNDNNQGNERIVKQLLLECRANKNFYQHESYNSLKEYASVLTGLLKEGVAEGAFRSDLDIAVTRDMVFGLLDEESLSCLAARELTATLPDFEDIMSLVLAMIKKEPDNSASARKDDKAKAVLSAATTIFSKKGFNGATMLEIGNEANVAEGTIYEYFINKQDLLLSIAKERFEQFKEDLDQTFKMDDPLTKLKRLIWNHFLIFFTNHEFLTLFLQDIKLNKHFYRTDSYLYFINYYSKLSEVLGEGKRTGVFRQRVNNRVFRNLFIGSFTHLLLRWLFISTPVPLTFMKEFTHATDMLCRAVVAKAE
ncbi:Transcriptional regulator, TetR family [Desulfosarcina cetonica]|nr:Transcriptional regulator, TetR family [Desulfosarcina cetonica]